ncbi:protein-disulfide reductase DsbD family protein [Methylobacterium durans]|uniref:protein-disulfide reductase DsbD family protein n=1 Tax=Methylobacterium durans TaxID=2202825 RepID=UPI002B003DDD|nr:protein-disulfide reductase DsbD domain-containing protein [Methylobacterium durans]MEA1831658.1 protein-disulfide reductase DsbD family protein [Methylobacterium durans]
MIRLLSLLVLLLGLNGAAAQGFKAPTDLVRASLVAEPAALRAGEPFTVALRLVMKPGWHVYWRNPGDSGLPPEMVWTLPAGVSAGPIQWPAPHRIPVAHLMNYGYEGETALLVTVTPPPSLDPAIPVRLSGKLSYLVCEMECVPGSASLSLTLPVTSGPAQADPASAALFARARAALPKPAPGPAHLSAEGDHLVLATGPLGLDPDSVRSAVFFPYSETAIDNAAPQDLKADAAGLRLTLARATPSEPPPATLPGVLAVETGGDGGTVRHAFAIGEEPAPDPAAGQIPDGASPAPAAPAAGDEALTLLSAAGLAFLGGLLLNLMPCVFPVLSIKVLSLVRHSGEAPARVRLHGLAYTAGVLAAFLALAGLLIALKSGGATIGWGFQLQSPLVVAGLAYLLLAMGLSLSGVVHLGGGLAGIGDGLARRGGLEGSFFTGVLATVVATPCTAPFMGAAVGFALTQSALTGLIVFASLGLGLALPFLALTAWPGALARLPRPGAWMETLKGALAFPVYATAAWLVWVLAQQVGPTGLLAALLGLVLVAFAAWAWEQGRHARPVAARLAQGLALAALLGAGALALGLDRDRAIVASAAGEGAEPFTQARLAALLGEGRPVFVNLTAAWCITCQVNERTALATDAVQAALKARGITYLKGDWTNQNPEITQLLERHGRSGVPLYLLYTGAGAPAVLPQILTKGTVLTALETVVPAGAPRSAALGERP